MKEKYEQESSTSISQENICRGRCHCLTNNWVCPFSSNIKEWWFLRVLHFGNTFMTFICNSVTAYPIQDDAIQTGELDYVNGGTAYMKFI